MKTTRARFALGDDGSALVAVVVFGVLLGIGCVSLLSFSGARIEAAHHRWNATEAFYHAENVLNWGAQYIADSSGDPVGTYAVSDTKLALNYMEGLKGGGSTSFQDAWLTIAKHPSGQANQYQVTSSAKVGNRVRTVQATVLKNPPSEVFDYEYFLNNWGWWWGASITGNGGNRANGDFDFRGNPTVNGMIIANGAIESDGTRIDRLGATVPINGLAGSNPLNYLHDGAPKLEMPNLKNFDYYETMAATKGGTLYVGSNLMVQAVHTNTVRPGIYLRGTAANPIKIDGPVVIPGDVVISGPITGVGTLYVGGNLYIAGDITYANGPDFSTPPETQSASTRDAWVKNNLDAKKDLVAFAVRESIFGGQVNSAAWKAACVDPAPYGLKHVGAEENLGADGIPGSGDDGVNFWNTSGSGAPNSAWYDADADGVVDVAYDYSNDVQLTTTRAGRIEGYPTVSDVDTTPKSYDDLSSNNFNTLNGIFYCNHAAAMRAAKNNFVMNGSLICRDEAIIFSSSAKFNYDSRIHSRYSSDPNRYVDLGLPKAAMCRVSGFAELKPVEGFYGQ
ncbi:MAG: hypothetical protein IPK15_20415 [Verrucomicrobia bacterium]|nr:hypothetical protein [Verrucomicrobiota bacterium]